MSNVNVLAFLDVISSKVNYSISQAEKAEAKAKIARVKASKEYVLARQERRENAKEREVLRLERQGRNVETAYWTFGGIVGGWLFSFIFSGKSNQTAFIRRFYSISRIKDEDSELDAFDWFLVVAFTVVIAACIFIGVIEAFFIV